LSKLPIVVVADKANKYSLGVLLGYLVGYLKREGIYSKFKFILTSWDSATQVIASLGESHILLASLLTTQVVQNLHKIAETVEVSRRLGGVTVAGGPHPSGDPYGTVLRLGFDLAFIGEAEQSFAQFIDRLVSANDYFSVEGTVAVSEDGIRARFDHPRVDDLDSVPPFCEELGLLNPIEIMRGCPHACRYCQVSFMFGAVPRFRSIESTVEYAKRLLRRGIRDIRFISPSGFHYEPRHSGSSSASIVELLEVMDREVRSLGGRIYLGTFPSEVRPEHVTDELLRSVRGLVNNRRINIGAQSGSDRLLGSLRRGHSAEDVLNAVSVARRHGFGVDVDYILGLPGESDEDVAGTLSHIEKVIRLGGRIHCHVFMPLPGTPLSFAPPGRVSDIAKKVISRIVGRGVLWGRWLKQEELASRIARLRDSYMIIVSYARAMKVLSEEKLPLQERSGCFMENLRKVVAKLK
jgi:B12-binding domain/radical SAM domain protein